MIPVYKVGSFKLMRWEHALFLVATLATRILCGQLLVLLNVCSLLIMTIMCLSLVLSLTLT